jgi:ABC-2 type transport system ATP-binding protein
VRTPDPDRLTELIKAEGGSAVATANGGTANTSAANTCGAATTGQQDDAPVLTVSGLPAARIGELAASSGIVLHELTPQLASLEDAFLELTAGSLEYGHLDAQPADWSAR